ncbi:hypothetical protein MMC19_005184 [Ptychographa xylographoides]|nr:hypothetical protein [Ptychographa xylographoides]
MSKVRGISGLFLATVFGIVNGVAIFGPEFKNQERQKLQEESKHQGIYEGQDSSLSQDQISRITSVSNDRIMKNTTTPSTWSLLKFRSWKTFLTEGDRLAQELNDGSKIPGNTTAHVVGSDDSESAAGSVEQKR